MMTYDDDISDSVTSSLLEKMHVVKLTQDF